MIMTEAAPPPLTKSMKWMIGNDDYSYDNHIGWSWIDDDGDFDHDDDDGDQWW